MAEANDDRGMVKGGKIVACGHPAECLRREAYDDVVCGWCEEVANWRDQANTLRRQLEDKAVILQPGEHDLSADTIGLLECQRGVTVNIHGPHWKKNFLGTVRAEENDAPPTMPCTPVQMRGEGEGERVAVDQENDDGRSET